MKKKLIKVKITFFNEHGVRVCRFKGECLISNVSEESNFTFDDAYEEIKVQVAKSQFWKDCVGVPGEEGYENYFYSLRHVVTIGKESKLYDKRISSRRKNYA